MENKVATVKNRSNFTFYMDFTSLSLSYFINRATVTNLTEYAMRIASIAV